MKLTEVSASLVQHIEQHEKERDKIATLMKSMLMSGQYTINDDLTVDVNGDISVPANWMAIPVHFNRVAGMVGLEGCNLSNLNDLPKRVGSISLFRMPRVRTLNGFEQTHHSFVVDDIIEVTQTHILGLCLIPGIQKVKVTHKSGTPISWNSIVFDISHHDPFQFQEQLLEHGLTEQAQF